MGQNAALALSIIQGLAREELKPTIRETNSNLFLLQEWLGVPSGFTFPMIAGVPRPGNVKQLIHQMRDNLILEDRTIRMKDPLMPGHHHRALMEKHQENLAEYQPEIDFTMGLAGRLDISRRDDMNGLIWMVRHNPGIGLKELNQRMTECWKNYPRDPGERAGAALEDLRDQTARAGQAGLAVSARAPEQRDSIPQGAPVCATHQAPYEFDQDGRRFHLLKDQIHWACWEGSRTLTGVSLGVPPHPDPTEHENPG